MPYISKNTRALLESREKSARRVQFVLDIPRPRRLGEPDRKVGPWCEAADGALRRYLIVPTGLDEESPLTENALSPFQAEPTQTSTINCLRDDRLCAQSPPKANRVWLVWRLI